MIYLLNLGDFVVVLLVFRASRLLVIMVPIFESLTHTLRIYRKSAAFFSFSPRGLIYGKVSDFPFPSAGTSFNCVLILVAEYIDF